MKLAGLFYGYGCFTIYGTYKQYIKKNVIKKTKLADLFFWSPRIFYTWYREEN